MNTGSSSSKNNINIGLDEQSRTGVIVILNSILADEFVLYVKTLHAHWNGVGPDFKSMHLFFEDLYEQQFEIIDKVAERVRALGGVSFASLADYQKGTALEQNKSTLISTTDAIEMLLKDHEAVISSLRGNIDRCLDEYGDAGTNNFLTEVLEQHEKNAWMIRSHCRHI